MWRIIDQQMSLKECTIYCYSPDEDPYEGEEGLIWSLNYFFFNKTRKRVCYLYLRGISVLSHIPTDGTATPIPAKRHFDDGFLTPEPIARKRTKYWAAEPPALRLSTSSSEEEEDERRAPGPSKASRPVVDEFDNYILSDEEPRSRSNSKVMRAMSEEIADWIEI
jgi:hypothetical protein